MDFSLSDEQREFMTTVERFARERVVPAWSKEADDEGIFLTEAWEALGEMGMFGLPFPEEYGGAGAPAVLLCAAGEAMGRGGVDGGTCLSWGASTVLCGVPIWKLGTSEQKAKYLPKMCTGEWIGGFCLTEPDSGSDAAAMKTRAVRDGDSWVINGSKTWITNGPTGHHFIVTAVTDPEAKPRAAGISTFIVDADTPGFRVGRKLDKLGHRTSPTSEIFFEDMRVPGDALLGPENYGFMITGKLILGWERACLMAPALGSLWHGIEVASKYGAQRHQFGRPITSFGAIKEKIADMRVAYEVAWAMLYRVADLLDRDEPCLLEAALLKTYLSEAGVQAANEVLQIHGGYGFSKEYRVERGYRDCKLGTIGGGTSEIQRGIIARAIGGF
ncbi:MAG: acyl-CoA dehydrogenase family protein [Myxococcota bacterium]|nr:acyl-CoA dehydrogenase family protein [Myxococcota bacterium]